jgi:hypothetical protein
MLAKSDGAETPEEPQLARSHAAQILQQIYRAIRDPLLDRGALRIFANVVERINPATGTAYPGHERMAAEEDMSTKTVNNKLHMLRAGGYLSWCEGPDPHRPTRNIRHYALCDQITEAVTLLRAKANRKAPVQLSCPAERATALPAGQVEAEVALPSGQGFALPAGHRETYNYNSLSPPPGASTTSKRERPHMNGVGFVISEAHGLIVPLDRVNEWRDRFRYLSDLEAKLEGLSTSILKRGFMHPGWSHPDSWMASKLADDNAEAKRKHEKHQQDVKVARPNNHPIRTFRR